MRPLERPRRSEEAPLEPGTGAQCPDSQADGVPCDDLDHECEECGNAVPRPARERSGNPPEAS